MSSFLCFCFLNPRPKIPEEYLRPQGLYSLERVDLKKLKRLIRNKQLAPCHPGVEEPGPGQDLEECPICFLHYSVLNSSLCCHKRVCTECFLQVQTSTPPHQLSACPFCKVTRPTGYLVKLIGAKTAEEKEQERVEEQKVIEARIREREEEVRRDQERALQRQQQQQQQQQQRPSAGVVAAAAAAASSLEPTGGGSSAPGGGRAASRGTGATASAASPLSPELQSSPVRGGAGIGGQYAEQYQTGTHRPRPAAAAAAAAGAGAAGMTAGGPTTTSVQAGGGGGGGIFPTAAGRRAAAAAAATAMSPGLQPSPHRSRTPADRYVVGPEAVGGAAHGDAPENGAAPAAPYGVGGGGYVRRHQGIGGRRYRLTDYIPAGVADIVMGLDDINDLMLEQAMYESLAAAASPSQAQPSAAAATAAAVPDGTRGGGGGGGGRRDVIVADPDNDIALAAALAASTAGGGSGAESPEAGRTAAAPPVPVRSAPAAVAALVVAGGPAGRSGWRQAGARSGQPTVLAPTSSGGAFDTTAVDRGGGLSAALTAAAAADAPPSPPFRVGRTDTATPPGSRSADVPVRAPAHPSGRQLTWGSAVASRSRAQGGRYARGGEGGGGETEEEEGDALFSRRDGMALSAAAAGNGAAGGRFQDGEAAVAAASIGTLLTAAAAPAAAASAPPQSAIAVQREVDAPQPVGAPPLPHSPSELPPPVGPRPDEAPDPTAVIGLLAAAAQVTPTTATGTGGVGASIGAVTPTSLSPMPSEDPADTLMAAASDLSSAATGGAAAGDDPFDAVRGGGAAAAVGGGDKHVTNPLYDIWSNSSSTTTTTLKRASIDPPGLGLGLVAAAAAVEAAAEHQEEALAAAAADRVKGVGDRWGAKTSSERSSAGSDACLVPRRSPCCSQERVQQQQAKGWQPSLAAPGASSLTSEHICMTLGRSPSQGPPMRPPPPPPLELSMQASATNATGASVTPASPPMRTSGGITDTAIGGLPTPSPRLGLPPLSALAAAAAFPSEEAPQGPAGEPGKDAGEKVSEAVTAVTMKTLAAELLRHGSGAAAVSGDSSSAASVRIVAVGMVFLAQGGGIGASGSGLRQSRPPPPVEGPAWAENPDGSMQLLVPTGAAAAAAPPPPPQHSRSVGGCITTSDDVMDVPYADYDLPDLQPLPSLGTAGLNLPAEVPYMAVHSGNMPATVAVEGMDPADEAEVEAADEALVRRCAQADAQLVRLVAAEDAAVEAAIAAGDQASHLAGGSAGGTGEGGRVGGGCGT